MTTTRSIGEWTGRLMAGLVLTAQAQAWGAAAAADEARFRLYEVKAPYAHARQDLIDAIINRGLVVDNVSRIAKMLARTGEAVGARRRVYLDAEALQFCSAVYSRRMMEADPRNILYCPYVMVIYRTVEKPAVVRIGYRRPDPRGSPGSQAALNAVDRLLDSIAREAAGVD